jgi:hypothetical protein
MKSPSAQDRAIYLYAVTPATNSRRVLSAAGVDGLAPVEAVPTDALMCWISVVDGAEFGDRLEKNMENLEWLAAASVRHQQVVAEIASLGDVLPARFGTVFLSVDSLLQHVRQNHDSLKTALQRISGCEEWGIKVFAEPQHAKKVAASAASGADYLKQKASQFRTRTQPREDAELTAFVGELRDVSTETAPSGKVSSGQPRLQWQGAFLVPRKNRQKLQRILERFAAKWSSEKRIDCSGPWPPYSFVSMNGR